MWFPTARAQHKLDAYEAVELYIYACKSGNMRLKVITSIGTYDKHGDHVMTNIDEAKLTRLSSQDAYRLVRHFKYDSARL